MSKPSPARYRTMNWSSSTAALRQRGSLLIWLDKDMTWLAPHDGSPGRPALFSDAAIQFCLTIKVLFKLPWRQTTGMVASLLEMAELDWAVPGYTTLCRRQSCATTPIRPQINAACSMALCCGLVFLILSQDPCAKLLDALFRTDVPDLWTAYAATAGAR
jgi:hypothetical protein